MSAERIAYLDSSALVKLVSRETESDAVARHLGARGRVASSAVARVEVVRAARRHDEMTVERARRVLADLMLIAVSDPLLERAAVLADTTVRSLDAIHLAAAESLGDDLREIVTYDRRMAEAARGLGMAVVAPA